MKAMTRSTIVRRIGAACMLAVLGASLSGCIVAPIRGPGWCYYHPYRCR
jgi:hypothetical protein